MEAMIKEMTKNAGFVCVYEYSANDNDSFIFGRFLAVDHSFVIIQRYSPDGRDDGILVLPIDSIVRIETNNKYITKMKKIIKELTDYEELIIPDENCISSVIDFARTNRQIVSIELQNSGYTDAVGLIKKIGDDLLHIQQIDEYGELDGETVFRVNDITQISLGSETERVLMQLFF